MDSTTISKANEWMMNCTNESFERFKVPIRISVDGAEGPNRTRWKIEYLDGASAEAAILCAHIEQDRILKNSPFDATKEEALFMATSQWFEWLLSGGTVQHPAWPAMQRAIHIWITIWHMRGGTAA